MRRGERWRVPRRRRGDCLLSSPVIAAQPGWGSAAHEESGDERTGSQPNALRRAAHWVWNALTPKAVLDRRERRRSLPAPGDFGSPGGGGALRKPPKRRLELPSPPPEPPAPDPPRRAEDRAYIVHSQVLMAWVRRSFPCPSCRTDDCLEPGTLSRVWGSYGMLMNVQCRVCSFTMQFRGGERSVMPQ